MQPNVLRVFGTIANLTTKGEEVVFLCCFYCHDYFELKKQPSSGNQNLIPMKIKNHKTFGILYILQKSKCFTKFQMFYESPNIFLQKVTIFTTIGNLKKKYLFYENNFSKINIFFTKCWFLRKFNFFYKSPFFSPKIQNYSEIPLFQKFRFSFCIFSAAPKIRWH